MLLLGRGGVRVVGGFGRARDGAEHRRHGLLFLYSAVSSLVVFMVFYLCNVYMYYI